MTPDMSMDHTACFEHSTKGSSQGNAAQGEEMDSSLWGAKTAVFFVTATVLTNIAK